MIKKEILEQRFKTWQSLLDISTHLALAGMKLKGYSEEESLAILRRHWIKAFQEHRQADSVIIKKLYGTRNKNR